MEAFESFVAVALESEGFVVSEAVKFPVQLQTKKAAYEMQTHGYEVDLVAARADRLVLATVKSFFGSRGVVAEHVTGEGGNERWRKLYALLNNPAIRDQVIAGAAKRYGYGPGQVELHLYVGRFAAPTKGTHEKRIRAWAAEQHAGAGPIKVQGLSQVVGKVRAAAVQTEYRDNPVLVTIKVLQAAEMLASDLPDGGSSST
jgi:hypothetical protein